MDNKQIEEAVEHIKSDMQWLKGDSNEPYYQTLLSLGQLFLEAKKGMPKKKTIGAGATSLNSEIQRQKYVDGYNLCHDEFTACLAERMEGIDEIIQNKLGLLNEDRTKELAQAIKTMILGGEGK